MIENSKIPVWLSYVAPINIGAITLGFIVISRDEMSEQTRRHETIHYQQYLDLFFVGFVVLYLWDWFVGLLIHKKGNIAYYSIRAEQEAYVNDHNMDYLSERKRYAWLFDYKVKSPPYLDQLLKEDNDNA
jgi:hypothetical protein